jgi:hypothetical protein
MNWDVFSFLLGFVACLVLLGVVVPLVCAVLDEWEMSKRKSHNTRAKTWMDAVDAAHERKG